jgi:DNA-binding transcriptional LysR family regulator
MFLTELDRSRRLLKITMTGHTTVEEARSALDSLRSLLADIQPGFRLFTDLSGLLSMPTTAAPYIGQIMESCAEKEVELVVRLLPPEPSKDIGFAIMSHFHYGPDIRIVTCATMEEAASYLRE